MDELSIKVNIGGRTYPLTIKRSEEELIRKASKNINDVVKDLQANYAVKDMQDLLAMTALQMATQLSTKRGDVEKEHTNEDIAGLETMITEYLNK
jgi:cell division protein ZapA (FtsZ GTPase activity inhibitor)